MKRNLIIYLITIVSGLLLFIGCGQQGSTDETENDVRIPVETMKVQRKTVEKEVSYTGDIRAEQEVKVFSKVPDRILSFEVDEGDYVNVGDLIARIEATKIKEAVNQAKAGLVSAKAQFANFQMEYQRAQRLIKEDAMSQQQFDAIKTQFEAAQAGVDQAEAALAQTNSQLADANVTAPISGIVGTRYYEQGDLASGPLPLVTVVQMNRVKVIVNAPEQDFGQLKLGQCATIAVMSYPDETFTGQITKISPVLDPITRMGKIEIMVDNADKRLKPGMFAEVGICIKTLEDVIAVPKHAVLENTELKRVNGQDVAVVNSEIFVEENGIALLREIEVSYTNGTISVVSSGLNEGENIVIVGQQSLKDSVKVNVTNQGE